MTRRIIVRLFVSLALIVLSVVVTRGQERAPNGEIYGELRPFVGLEGVRYQITGLQAGTFFNIPGPGNVADPEKTLTGLSRAEREELNRAVYDDVEQILRRIPLSGGPASTNEVAVLAIDIRWARVRPDLFTVHVTIDLMEAARLMKDPSRIVWTSSWRSAYNSIASRPEQLPAVVRSVTRNEVESFARLYERAHAK